MLSAWKQLYQQQQHILNLNRRNVAFILAENDRRLYPFVDHKGLTKLKLAEADIATPALIATIHGHRQVSQLDTLLKDETAFAVKPAQGSGGGGILIVVERTRLGFRKPNGQVVRPEDLAFHLHNLLNGLYSLGGKDDEVIIEALIRPMAVIPNLPLAGVPDIRILLYRGIAVAAMLRLPTFESDGKANLHMGGVGVGLDVATGRLTHATHRNRAVTYHPEYDVPLLGHTLPHWDQLLRIATAVYDAIPLAYMGIDLVLDQTLGPLVLEANARPGISIQLANRFGLLPRLETVQQRWPAGLPLDQRLAAAQQWPAAVIPPPTVCAAGQ